MLNRNRKNIERRHSDSSYSHEKPELTSIDTTSSNFNYSKPLTGSSSLLSPYDETISSSPRTLPAFSPNLNNSAYSPNGTFSSQSFQHRRIQATRNPNRNSWTSPIIYSSPIAMEMISEDSIPCIYESMSGKIDSANEEKIESYFSKNENNEYFSKQEIVNLKKLFLDYNDDNFELHFKLIDFFRENARLKEKINYKSFISRIKMKTNLLLINESKSDIYRKNDFSQEEVDLFDNLYWIQENSVSNFRVQNETLEQTLRDFKEDLENKIKFFNNEKEKLNGEIAKKEEEINKLKEDNLSFKKESKIKITELNKDIKDREAWRVYLEGEMTKIREENFKLEKKLEAFSENMDSEKADLIDNIEELTRKNQEWEQEINNWNSNNRWVDNLTDNFENNLKDLKESFEDKYDQHHTLIIAIENNTINNWKKTLEIEKFIKEKSLNGNQNSISEFVKDVNQKTNKIELEISNLTNLFFLLNAFLVSFFFFLLFLDNKKSKRNKSKIS